VLLLLLLLQFMEWSQCVCCKLQAQGYWCDYIDPCSGLPVRKGSMQAYIYCACVEQFNVCQCMLPILAYCYWCDYMDPCSGLLVRSAFK
jgi:hypothetical protein